MRFSLTISSNMAAKLSTVPLCWTYRTIIADTGWYQLAVQKIPQASQFYILLVLCDSSFQSIYTFPYIKPFYFFEAFWCHWTLVRIQFFNSAKCQNIFLKDKNSVGSYLAEKGQMVSEEVFNSMISCSCDRQVLWCAAINIRGDNCNQIISVYFYTILPTVYLNLSLNKLFLQTLLRQELIATYFRQN